MRKNARATDPYKGIVKTHLGISDPKKWLEKNCTEVERKTGLGVKPIRVKVGEKNMYFMTYAKACYEVHKLKGGLSLT